MTYPLVNSTGASWSESIPEAHVVGLDRSKDMGADSFIVHVRPLGAEYEYFVLCRAVSLTDSPPIAVVNISHGTWSNLCEFQIEPRTQVSMLAYGDYYMIPGSVFSLLDIGLTSAQFRLALADFTFSGVSQDLGYFNPYVFLDWTQWVFASVIPVWKKDLLIEGWMRLRHTLTELTVGSIGYWHHDLPIYAEASPYAAVPVSGVLKTTEGIWINGGQNRPYFYADAEVIRTNSIEISVFPHGGVIYLNLHQVPQWVKDMVIQGYAPYQIVITDVIAKPRHISDIGIPVEMEVRARA